jgi:uncharacterized protein
MAKRDNVLLLERFLPENNVVVLTHNPDTVRNYSNLVADITLAGHTHCGQVRIPRLYKYALPTLGAWNERFDCGLYMLRESKLFISAGL